MALAASSALENQASPWPVLPSNCTFLHVPAAPKFVLISSPLNERPLKVVPDASIRLSSPTPQTNINYEFPKT
eukprot:1590465-Amphidinium_carterae.1